MAKDNDENAIRFTQIRVRDLTSEERAMGRKKIRAIMIFDQSAWLLEAERDTFQGFTDDTVIAGIEAPDIATLRSLQKALDASAEEIKAILDEPSGDVS